MFEINEVTIRPVIFIGLFCVLALLEFIVPRRKLKPLKTQRWFTNWAIVIIDSVLVRLIFVGAAVGAAEWASSNGYGLFNLVPVPLWVAGVISFVLLDFSIWFTHWASHKVPVLWKIHRMHHADVDIDVSTAIRFHPIEIILSMVWKIGLVVLFGMPALSVLVFEIVLNGGALFNHSNFKIPEKIDRILRIFIVTPDMHRVHHSIIHEETDSNYGFNLAIWDRMFKTYIAQPEKGHEEMTIGIEKWQDERPANLFWSLKIPFLK